MLRNSLRVGLRGIKRRSALQCDSPSSIACRSMSTAAPEKASSTTSSVSQSDQCSEVLMYAKDPHLQSSFHS